ncbi:MAG: Nif3-like dinuclear metal center hexameric protein [Candidatus Thorarchaeota archaeon]|jgi:putative NIF3 family GTP cyclohydrolase 1 type 2/rhodanese-related sulfurtransferase
MTERINVEELEKLKSQVDDVVVLDVRPSTSFESGHIAGALSIPIYSICEQALNLPNKQKIVVYSQNAKDSMSTQAFLALKNQGFKDVQILDIGFVEWESLANPIAKAENIRSSEQVPSYKAMSVPFLPSNIEAFTTRQGEFIESDEVVSFLESRTQIYEFDHLGYEKKTVDQVSGIYLMINPDPINLELVPEGSLVISHHKISTHHNRIYAGMLEQAETNNFNIFNFHLGWDVMPDGIADSFLRHFGLSRHEYEKVDLTYRGHVIQKLGAIMNKAVSMEDLITRLQWMNVMPSAIINPQCKTSMIGYIPGGGFVDQMIIEMADLGVDVLISSDYNWVVETVAREVGVSLVEIDHYVSERYGLHSMRKLLADEFPKTPSIILENIDNIQCSDDDCTCSS